VQYDSDELAAVKTKASLLLATTISAPMPNNECNERDDKAPKRRVFKCGDRARKPKKTTKPSARSKMGTSEKRAEESKSEKVKGWALDVARQKGAELPRARVGSMRSYKQQLEEIERLRAELTSREAEICRRLSEKQRKWTKKDDVEHGLTDSATEPDSSNDEGQSDVVEDEENGQSHLVARCNLT
jgi:hypothetical protein